MKKFKYIKGFIIILSVFLTGACSVDDDLPITPDAITKITAQTAVNSVRIANTEDTYSVVVNFSNPLSSLSRLTYSVGSSTMEIDLAKGATQVELPVDMSGANILVKTLTIKDLKIINANTDKVSPSISENQNSTTIIKGIDVNNDVTFVLTWNDNSDLDCDVRDSAATIIDISQGFTDTEMVTLPETSADGEYFFTVRPWTINSNPLECYVTVINGENVSSYTGSLVDALPRYGTIANFVKITKTTDTSGSASFAFEQVLF